MTWRVNRHEAKGQKIRPLDARVEKAQGHSAAAAARMRLVERMFTHGNSEWLGMDAGKKPPEMSMYLSVLHNTGIHQSQDGTWRIVEPHHNRDKKCNVLPTLKRIREIVQSEPDARVNIAALFAELRRPPFGVRDGMIPLLLTAFAIAHEQDVAFYMRNIGCMSASALPALSKARAQGQPWLPDSRH